jgi:outer membrane protein OmpA-like peptidoglycan-associated protein
MYLRTDEQHLQGYGVAPAAVAKGVGTAVKIYSAVRDFFSSGGFTVNSDIVRYTHGQSPPGRKVQKCTRWFRIATYLDLPYPGPKQRFRDDSFNFKLEYEYDGSNLLGVRILPQEKGSSTLRKSKFDITFAGKDLSLPADPVAVIRYYISGTWEKWGPISSDRYKIEGELDVSADGSARLNVRSDDNRVLTDPMTNSCPITGPYAQVRKHYSLPILFRFNKDDISETYARQMDAWVASWPRETQEKVASGDITVRIEGFASRPGTGLYNSDLSERRAENTKKMLRRFTGSNTKFDTRAYGAYRQNLPSLFDVIQWIKRFLDPNKYDQAAVIWFEDVT